MGEPGWVLAAIEAEAMKRARNEILKVGPLMIFGLSAGQVKYLLQDWRDRHGMADVPSEEKAVG